MNLWQRIDQKLGYPRWPWTDRPIPANTVWAIFLAWIMRDLTVNHRIHNRVADFIVSTLLLIAFFCLIPIKGDLERVERHRSSS